MLVPKEWQQKQAFLLEAAKALAKACKVIAHFGCELKRADDLDFSRCVESMEKVCRLHRRDQSGMEDLRATISLFDLVKQHLNLDDEDFRRGLSSAQRLRWWLHQTFPDAGPNPKNN
jgi:hypothetical protein